MSSQVPAAPSSPGTVPLATLASNQSGFADKSIEVTGNLQQVGASYFTEPVFVLIDGGGNWVEVESWLPLETPPSPPGGPRRQILTMHDFLGKTVRLSGTHKLDAATGTYRFHVGQASIDAAGPKLTKTARLVLQKLHAERLAARQKRSARPPGAPLSLAASRTPGTIGTRKPLVLLVDFSDAPAQVISSVYSTLLFGSWGASLRDYYLQVSYGQLTLNGTVYGWLRLPHTLAYYVSGGDYGMGSYPYNAQKMVEDAVLAASAAGFNFGAYDTDSDGYLDDLLVVHAGQGAEWTGSSSNVWSHRWGTTYNVPTGSYNAAGHQIYVRGYSTEPEYWSSPGDMTIGVYAHEYGHQLDLPDLYDTDYSSEGIGKWSLMASASWNGSTGMGETPGHMDAWSKACLGWTSPTKVTTTRVNQAIRQASTYGDVFQFLDGTPCSGVGEYFLVENRYRSGFDSALPGSGLLVWHIDEAQSDNNDEWYPGCYYCSGHYLVALVQADNLWNLEHGDNRGDGGDPFPGYYGATNFTGTTSPNSARYNGQPTGVSITSISAASGTMTATLAQGDNRPPNDECANASLAGSSGYHDAEDTSGATTDSTDPYPGAGNSSRAKSVWYRATPSTAGTIRADTFGSGYDTILAAYTGSCGSLTAVPDAANDDAENSVQSLVSFVVNPGTTYWFMVTSYGGDGGTLQFTFGYVPRSYADFNADGRPDILWRNRVTGDIVFWMMNGTGLASTVQLSGLTDRNWKIVAIGDFDRDGNSDLVLRNAATGANQIWYMSGTSHTSSATLSTVADLNWQIVGTADFNRDGWLDLLWRNRATGQVLVWYMNAATYAGYASIGTVTNASWTIAGVDDFNHDGKPDLLWHNQSTGDTLVWYLNNAAYTGYASLPTRSDVNWTIVGTGDYNADGSADIVWRNILTGANEVHYLNGVTEIGSQALPATPSPDWDVLHSSDRAGPGQNDFNADGWSDILWHNTSTGQNRIWYMNRATWVADGTVDTEADLNWKSVAVADFNQDGLPDIVWRNQSTGENRIWLMTGAAHTGNMTLPTIADANWRVVGVGDFNRDGHPDLAWRNQATGANVIWFLHNGAYYNWTAPPTITDTNWQIVAVGDFNGDGWPDLFWRNQVTGANVAWFLVNGVYAGWGQPPTITDTTWQIVGAADFNADGKADLLWRNATTGQNLVWYLNNGTYIGFDWLPTFDIAWKTGAGQ